MLKPALPDNEAERVKHLLQLKLLDTPPERRYNRLVEFAARIFDVPTVLISLVDEDRQWFKAKVGLDVCETPRDISFCGHAILSEEVFVIPDATLDERFADNPLVTSEPKLRFYAGCPLHDPKGYRIGTLCLIDYRTREFDQDDAEALRRLAAIAEQELINPSADDVSISGQTNALDSGKP